MTAAADSQIRFEPRDIEKSIRVIFTRPKTRSTQPDNLVPHSNVGLTKQQSLEIGKAWRASPEYKESLIRIAPEIIRLLPRSVADVCEGHFEAVRYGESQRWNLGVPRVCESLDLQVVEEGNRTLLSVVHTDYPNHPVSVGFDMGADVDGLYVYLDISGGNADARSAVGSDIQALGSINLNFGENTAPFKYMQAAQGLWFFEQTPDIGNARALVEGWRRSTHFTEYIWEFFRAAWVVDGLAERLESQGFLADYDSASISLRMEEGGRSLAQIEVSEIDTRDGRSPLKRARLLDYAFSNVNCAILDNDLENRAVTDDLSAYIESQFKSNQSVADSWFQAVSWAVASLVEYYRAGGDSAKGRESEYVREVLTRYEGVSEYERKNLQIAEGISESYDPYAPDPDTDPLVLVSEIGEFRRFIGHGVKDVPTFDEDLKVGVLEGLLDRSELTYSYGDPILFMESQWYFPVYVDVGGGGPLAVFALGKRKLFRSRYQSEIYTHAALDFGPDIFNPRLRPHMREFIDIATEYERRVMDDVGTVDTVAEWGNYSRSRKVLTALSDLRRPLDASNMDVLWLLAFTFQSSREYLELYGDHLRSYIPTCLQVIDSRLRRGSTYDSFGAEIKLEYEKSTEYEFMKDLEPDYLAPLLEWQGRRNLPFTRRGVVFDMVDPVDSLTPAYAQDGTINRSTPTIAVRLDSPLDGMRVRKWYSYWVGRLMETALKDTHTQLLEDWSREDDARYRAVFNMWLQKNRISIGKELEEELWRGARRPRKGSASTIDIYWYPSVFRKFERIWYDIRREAEQYAPEKYSDYMMRELFPPRDVDAYSPSFIDNLLADKSKYVVLRTKPKYPWEHEESRFRYRIFMLVEDKSDSLVMVTSWPGIMQTAVANADYIVLNFHMEDNRGFDGYGWRFFLDKDLRVIGWDGTPKFEYFAKDGDAIFKVRILTKQDLRDPYIFQILRQLDEDDRHAIYKKIPRAKRTDPNFNTEDPYREIVPVDADDPTDRGVKIPPRYSPTREGAEITPFTYEDLTGEPAPTPERIKTPEPKPTAVDMSAVVEQSYDMSDSDQREAIEIAWGASPEYREFEANMPNVVDVSEIKAARKYLKDLLSSEGVETKAYARGRDIRLTLDKSVADAYIRIGDPYLDARLENRGSSPIPDDLKSKIDRALGEYATWQAPLRDNITDRQIAEMLPAIQEWMTANGISLVNGGLEDLYGLADDADVAQSIDADVDLQQRALDEDLEAALRRSDSETAAKIEAAKDALAQAHAAYVGAVESGDEATAQRIVDTIYSDADTIDHGEYYEFEGGTIDHGGYDEFEGGTIDRGEGTIDHGGYDDHGEGTIDHGGYDDHGEGTIDHGGYDDHGEGTIDHGPKDRQWGSAEDWARVTSLPTDEAVENNVEYALSLIDFDKITKDVIESLYADLDRRGLSKIRNTVNVNPNSGDVYVGAVGGYLEGIALPEGLSFDERRAFVKAIKSFEDRKYDANMDVLAQVASSLGLNDARKEDLLAYPIPQFTVRQDYLNEYVERAQPDEIELLKDEVMDLLSDFEQSPEKSKFNDLAPRIESLFRYDPSNVMYHSFLDRLIEAADATNWWKESARKRMPLYRRLQSRAAATYGDKGYVPVIEDPLVGLDRLAERVSDNVLQLSKTDPVEFYQLFDPSMYMACFEGADAADVYLGRKGLYDLPECVDEKLNPPQGGDEPPRGGDGSPSSLPGGSGSEYLYSYELFFGNFEESGARRCEDLKREVLPGLNERLEIVADSIFGNMDALYSLYHLATEVEIDVTYADKTGVRLKSDFGNNIEVALSETFGQADVDSVYRGMCGFLADIITSQEIDLDPEDSNIDADDLLNEMEIPAITSARPNSSDLSDLQKVLRDLEAISNEDDSVGDLDDLKAAYEECMGSEIGQWDSSQYVGESAEEADQRRLELAAFIGLGRYLPYDISYALDDSDFKDLLNRTLCNWLEVQSTYVSEVGQLDEFRRSLARVYRSIVFPKYFPKDGIRVVHITRKEADDFTRAHHSLLGGDSKEINPRGLELTIGAEVDGKLVAVAVANTPGGRGNRQLRETDLSRVSSDGSVKKVSSLLAGIVLQLTLDNKLNRDPSSNPLFITYSTIDEVGSTYMALLNMGLRPVSLSKPTDEPSGARRGSDMGDVYAYPKIRWEAGKDAKPANLDIARFLKLSYATEIESDPEMESVGEPWGDDYICLCILSTVQFPKSCKSYINDLRKAFVKRPKARGTARVRSMLMSYAQDQIERSGSQRSKNIKRYMRPITLCGQITNNQPVTSEGLRSIRRNILRIKDEISRRDTPSGCEKSDVKKALTSWDKSLNT